MEELDRHRGELDMSLSGRGREPEQQHEVAEVAWTWQGANGLHGKTRREGGSQPGRAIFYIASDWVRLVSTGVA